MRNRVVDDEIRGKIAEMYAEGARVPDIASEVGLHETSVYRELNRGLTDRVDEHGRLAYDIEKARLDAARARANKGKFKGHGVDGRSRRAQTD